MPVKSNKVGRPRGSKTSVKRNVNVERAVIKQLSERAMLGEQQAVDTLAMLMAHKNSLGAS